MGAVRWCSEESEKGSKKFSLLLAHSRTLFIFSKLLSLAAFKVSAWCDGSAREYIFIQSRELLLVQAEKKFHNVII